jgi:hypothetical protein
MAFRNERILQYFFKEALSLMLMTWLIISDTDDVKAFERRTKDFSVRIEARSAEQGWDVFKSYVDGHRSYLTENYHVDSLPELGRLLSRLKREKVLSRSELQASHLESSLNFSFERAYKEDFIEKWVFRADGTENFLVVRYDETISLDVVIAERYRVHEARVVERIRKTLGLDDLGDVKMTFYYYRQRSEIEAQSKKSLGVVIGRFEFDVEDE